MNEAKESVPPKGEVEVSRHGAELRTPAHGVGKLQIGNPASPGRPKKQVKEAALKITDSESIAWARRVLANHEIPDTDPSKARAAEFLGKVAGAFSHGVEVESPKEVIGALARVLLSKGFAAEKVEAVLMDAMAELGVE